MLNKYIRVLENREINASTGEVWKLQDVPTLWKSKAEARVIADGYHFLEDGTAEKNPVNEEE